MIKMTVEALLSNQDFVGLCIPNPQKEISGVYAGDLLSWVMGHAEEGECLITIMSNVNVLAVASLLDLPCVILAESVEPDEEFLTLAKEKGINVLKTAKSTYGACTVLYEELKK